MSSYKRDDGAEMVEVAAGQFVSRAAAEKLGLALPERRKATAPANKAKRSAPKNKRAKVPA